MDLILGHKIDLVIDTPTQGRDKSRDGFLIRRNAIETGVNCITAMDTARALVTSLENAEIKENLTPAVMEYLLGVQLQQSFGGCVSSDEIGLRVTDTGLVLPCGSTAIWEK